LLCAFFLFRLFDIWKPFPAREAQSLPGGAGVMVDDLIAGLYALVLIMAARWFFGGPRDPGPPPPRGRRRRPPLPGAPERPGPRRPRRARGPATGRRCPRGRPPAPAPPRAPRPG